ncbi:MAG TPA: RNA polymerase sigma factor [Myxococcaceae bacterium]|nr:RNA polymerase sigma factor [Myxococcaceae bacterium]
MSLPRKLEEPDPEVVRRAAAGDGDSLYALLRLLQPPLFHLAVRMLRHRADAEDATQEALLRIVTHLGQFRGESRFSTWAWRIAVHRIVDLARERADEIPTDFEALRRDLESGREPHAVERAEDGVLLRELKVVCSRAMLQCLNPDERIAFTLGDVLGLSSEEAAEVLDIERPAFRKRVSRARAALQRFLSSECGVYNPAAPCRCHSRLSRALELGRVVPGRLEVREGGLPEVRQHLAAIGEARRVTAFFRSDPSSESRRDLVEALRAQLGRLGKPEVKA